MKSKYFFLIIIIFFSSCAKRGVPVGGEKDEIPPKFTRAQPENNSTFFDDKKIRIYFDEYIKLDKLSSQLVVSPPIEKFKYSIFPQGGASKFIDIEINDELDENTTFVFNFGESIKDNNEGNLLPYFKYVFSTGSYIDSLELKGNINTVYNRKKDDYVTAMLYPLTESFNDSIIFKEKPLYVASTLDSTFFNFTNIKNGSYYLIAVKDINNNFIFDPLNDKIAYHDSIITLPTDKLFDLNLFKENPSYKIFKPFQEFSNRVSFGFRGNIDSIKITSNVSNIHSTITKDREKDTIHYWFRDFEYDTLSFNVSNKDSINLFKLPKRDYEKDTLILSEENSSFELGNKFILNSTVPILKIDSTKIKIINKDSVVQSFKSKIKDEIDIVFDFEILPNDKYSIEVLPNGITDFFGNSTDTLNYSFTTKKRSDYGNIYVNLSRISFKPIIVDLINMNEEIVMSKTLLNSLEACVFENIKPGDYNLRLIHDKNNNGKWDTGDYLNKNKPEEVIHYNDTIKVRANWVIRERI